MKVNINKPASADRGFIKMILLIIIVIVVLSYFGFDLKNIFTSDLVQDNLSYAWGVVVKIWNLFIDYIWTPVLNFFV